MAIHKYLDCSTTCIPRGELGRIMGGRHVGLVATKHEHGVWVWANSDIAPDMREDLPNLCAVLDYAVKMGCKWVNFDRDGLEIEGLPTFEEDW
jgi:hypothetical protein